MTPDSAFTWFREATYGLFLHWGPYTSLGRGEQVLMREMLNQEAYADMACTWNPQAFDASTWADIARRGGFRYGVFTTRHHDGFCLWDTDTTDYSSARQAAGRDFVREYVEAFRDAGLKVGFYFSWSDFRIPAMFRTRESDPEGWDAFRAYVHAQLRELMTRYGKIDVLWFDGVWPGSASDWGSAEIVQEIRQLQPGILINNRLGYEKSGHGGENEFGANEGAGGDFGTPEHHITAIPGKLWESCQVSTWRLWCHSHGERWRSTEQILDMLTEASSKGGNLLLNVGPDADGRIPHEFIERSDLIGDWLLTHGEAVYSTAAVDVGETVLFGRQSRVGNAVYLIIRFWPGETLRFQGLKTPVKRATLLTSGRELEVTSDSYGITLHGLPKESPHPLFPVIKLELDGRPASHASYHSGLWGGDPSRFLAWAEKRGHSVMACGKTDLAGGGPS